MSNQRTATEFVARVIANRGADLLVRDDTHRYFTAVPQKKLGLVVCGDRVHCEMAETPAAIASTTPESPHGTAVRVSDVAPRTGVLARTDRRGQPKPIAANVTQLVVVTAPTPPFDPLLIDRYTIAARHMGVKLLLVINKADLLTADSAEQQQASELAALYRSIGYPVIRCSSKHDQNLDALSVALDGETSILVGQSGVGKSSILDQLLPEQTIKTGALSEISGLGRHTTTVTTWYELASGGAIIDSAGVRQFSLEHLSEVDIQTGFVEIDKLSQDCKFRDCSHQHEPDCAVLQALETQQLTTQRYEHFITLRTDS